MAYRAKVKFVSVGGAKFELHTIGYVAQKVGRSTLTLRRWERLSIIPSPVFKSKTGRRLYTNEEIDLLGRLIEELGLRRGLNILETRFHELVTTGFNRIRKTFETLAAGEAK